MNSQQLLIINFIVLSGLILFFILSRLKDKQHVRLNIKTGEKESLSEREGVETSNSNIETLVVTEVTVNTEVTLDVPHSKSGKDNVVYFLYNGHEWEVYEVLGLPRGSSFQIVTSQYQNLIKTSDPSTFEFYDAAYAAILKLQSKN